MNRFRRHLFLQDSTLQSVTWLALRSLFVGRLSQSRQSNGGRRWHEFLDSVVARSEFWSSGLATRIFLATACLAGIIHLGNSVTMPDLPRPGDNPRFPGVGLHFASFDLPSGSEILSVSDAARMIEWPEDRSKLGRGLKIGMIDGAVNINHPALKDQDIRARDFRTDSSLAVPTDHATAVAALLIGTQSSEEHRGLLPNATLYSANIFSIDESDQLIGDPTAFFIAVRWMIDEGVSVINVSLTGKSNPLVAAAIKDAISHGVQVVAAAGNNPGHSDRNYPAAYDGVLSATAVDAGLVVYEHASTGSHIDFSAPGVALRLASDSGSEVLSGTSFAVPFLTAAVAVAKDEDPHLGPEGLRQRIVAVDLGANGADLIFGRGLIDFNYGESTAATLRAGSRSAPARPRRIDAN
jgi:subtilisin family serine protease